MLNNIDYSLYLVTDRGIIGDRDITFCVEQAIKGGTTIVQLREKETSTRDFYSIALKVKRVTDKYNIPLIINDRLDIALAVNAAGVHVGQSDMPCDVARKILGEDKIIGVSATNFDEAVKASRDGADYVGVGSMFKTTSKDDAKYVSIDTLKKIKHHINIPIVGIGGINVDNVNSIIEAGADGVAIISSILSNNDIKEASNRIYKLIKKLNN